MALIENLKWRYATKKYDPNKKVSPEKLEEIKEAVMLSASSYGLQPYKVLIVENNEIREKLKPVSWGQSQITDASHLFVFCNYTNVEDKEVDLLMQLKSETNGVNISNFNGYGDFVKEKIKEKSPEEILHWTAKQTYIALANAMAVCAELKIDCTPIEGFEPQKYNALLGLEKKGLNASVVLAIGFRDQTDMAQKVKKTRKSKQHIFESVY